MPYAIGLVLTGLVLGNVLPYSGPHLSKELLFLVVLPGLLFEAAFQIHFSEVWGSKGSIVTLAVPGLVVVTLLTALLVWWGVNALMPGSIAFIEAMVFGALISATDPVSVLAIFRTLGVDKRLAVIVEAESLFNDGTAIVVFTIVLGMATGTALGVGAAAIEFVRVAGLAIVVGAVVGFAVSLVTRTIDDPTVEITLTVLTAYGAFIAAEWLGLSGVIACVVAGMVTGNWGARARHAAGDARGRRRLLELCRLPAQQLRLPAHGRRDQSRPVGALPAGDRDRLAGDQRRARRPGLWEICAHAHGPQRSHERILGGGALLGRRCAADCRWCWRYRCRAISGIVT